MPGTDGLALLKEVKENYPGLPVIIMTAYSDLDSSLDTRVVRLLPCASTTNA